MDFKDFSQLMRKRAKNVPVQVHEVVKNVTKVYLVTVADMTPVDTGAAISNWQVGVNSVPSGVIGPYMPGRFRSTALENLNATIGAGTAIIDSSRPGDVFHVANNIEYIADLNDGTSTQAPRAFVQLAMFPAERVMATAKVVSPK